MAGKPIPAPSDLPGTSRLELVGGSTVSGTLQPVWYDDVFRAGHAVRGAAEVGIRRARARIRYAVENSPLQVVAGCAVVGFLAGMMVRVWRSNRYERKWTF